MSWPPGNNERNGSKKQLFQHKVSPAVPPPVPARSTPPPAENKSSLLLSPLENRLVFGILGRGRQTVATAVACLLVPTTDQRQWQMEDCTGVEVICFVKDSIKRSYFIQFYSLLIKRLIFSQEIYGEFQYRMPTDNFMTFEGDNSMIGILFADQREAYAFREALDMKLEADERRHNKNNNINSYRSPPQANFFHRHPQPQPKILHESNVRNAPPPIRPTIINPNHNNNNGNNVRPPSLVLSSKKGPRRPSQKRQPTRAATSASSSSNPSFSLNNIFNSKTLTGTRKGKGRSKLSTRDIGTPMEFRHVQHVGFDPNEGFNYYVEDKGLQAFLEKAGVSGNQLKDEKTRKFIYDFIEQNGVADLVKRTNSTYSGIPANKSPPPPPPPIPGRVAPTPPPPPPPPPHSPFTSGPVPPPPPPPQMQMTSPARGGQAQPSCSPHAPAPVPDDRSQLMQQIQQKEFTLKKVDTGTQPRRSPKGGHPQSAAAGSDTMDDMAGALSRALAERQRAINPDSSGSDEDEDDPEIDDDEWED